uniref:Uncharacterized protein n=1 Tax=Cacopsylla melanoneura TaxID=428564 RepID=A0A8D9E850_9HEMI
MELKSSTSLTSVIPKMLPPSNPAEMDISHNIEVSHIYNPAYSPAVNPAYIPDKDGYFPSDKHVYSPDNSTKYKTSDGPGFNPNTNNNRANSKVFPTSGTSREKKPPSRGKCL